MDTPILETINAQYILFRKAFNCKCFKMGNALHFNDEDLRQTESDFQHAKALLEQRSILQVMGEVQTFLDRRKLVSLIFAF